MIEYRSEDYEPLDWKAELRKVLGDKLIGVTTMTPNNLIEFRTTVELEANEMNELRSLTGKDWTKQK